MAQSAVAAIKSGCQMLSEGRAEIQNFKKGVEQTIGDAKAIYQEVTGLWSWVKGLFGVRPEKAVPLALPATESKPETKRKTKESELTYEQYQARSVHEVCEHLKVFFEAQRGLEQHCRELEAQSSTTENVADNAIDLIEIRWQMQQLSKQVRETMAWTPEELGLQDMYKQFLKMYEQILEKQEFERQVKHQKEVNEKWRRELLKNHRIDRAIIVVTVLILVMWTWGFLLSFRWLVTTQSGSWSEW
jgi:hypothetical protein